MSGKSPLNEAVAASAPGLATGPTVAPMDTDYRAPAATDVLQTPSTPIDPGMTEAFQGYLRLAGDGLAEFTDFQGWKLSEPEVRELAVHAEACRKRYFPTVGAGESAPAVGLVVALIGSFGMRYYLFKKWQAARAAEARAREAQARAAAAGGQAVATGV